MAVRNPLYVSGGNLIAMSTGDIEQYRQKATFLYSQAPSAVLTVVSGSGALISAIDDTRTKAGAASQSASAFVYADSTAEPATVTVSYDKVNLAYTSTGAINETADTGTSFPVYYDNSTGAIRSMNLTDFLDTFIYPAIISLSSSTESSATAGTYTVTTSATAASNYTQVSSTAIFADTRANTGAYSAAGIPETLDQPSTITEYFLHRRDGTDNTPARIPLFVNSGNNLQEFSASDINTLVGDWLRFTAAHDTSGYKISYNIGASGNGAVRGSAMTDTKLDGSGLFQTLQVNIDDYRSQEFPNGTAQNISLNNLRIHYS
jgi:hypothetical protein